MKNIIANSNLVCLAFKNIATIFHRSLYSKVYFTKVKGPKLLSVVSMNLNKNKRVLNYKFKQHSIAYKHLR